MRPRVAGSARWMSSSVKQRDAPVGEPLERPEDRLDDAAPELVRRDEVRGAAVDAKALETLGQAGHQQAEIVAGRADGGREALIGQAQEHAGERIAHGLVGHADGRAVRAAAAGHHAGHHRRPGRTARRGAACSRCRLTP